MRIISLLTIALIVPCHCSCYSKISHLPSPLNLPHLLRFVSPLCPYCEISTDCLRPADIGTGSLTVAEVNCNDVNGGKELKERYGVDRVPSWVYVATDGEFWKVGGNEVVKWVNEKHGEEVLTVDREIYASPDDRPRAARMLSLEEVEANVIGAVSSRIWLLGTFNSKELNQETIQHMKDTFGKLETTLGGDESEASVALVDVPVQSTTRWHHARDLLGGQSGKVISFFSCRPSTGNQDVMSAANGQRRNGLKSCSSSHDFDETTDVEDLLSVVNKHHMEELGLMRSAHEVIGVDEGKELSVEDYERLRAEGKLTKPEEVVKGSSEDNADLQDNIEKECAEGNNASGCAAETEKIGKKEEGFKHSRVQEMGTVKDKISEKDEL